MKKRIIIIKLGEEIPGDAKFLWADTSSYSSSFYYEIYDDPYPMVESNYPIIE